MKCCFHQIQNDESKELVNKNHHDWLASTANATLIKKKAWKRYHLNSTGQKNSVKTFVTNTSKSYIFFSAETDIDYILKYEYF